jgi:hypothetical protein
VKPKRLGVRVAITAIRSHGKNKAMNETRTRRETTASGFAYRDEVSGEVIFETILSADGSKRYRDFRKKPPFTQILPCPYCGVTEDRGHDPRAHVNTHLVTETLSPR